MKVGDRIQIDPDLLHWSSGVTGEIVSIDPDPVGSKYPIGVLLDLEDEKYPIGYRERELILVPK
jgi:hypothetical protein